MEIKNLPKAAKCYEFIVAENRNNNLYFVDMFTEGHRAEECAKSLRDGVVIHNVRIQGFKPENHTYTFNGTWHWECEAENEIEAVKQYYDAMNAFKMWCRSNNKNLFSLYFSEPVKEEDDAED